MRISIYGAGAGGGHFAVRLAQAGHEVSLIARGGNLTALQRDGLTLISGGRRDRVRLTATDDPATLGVQDVVIMAMKATALAGTAAGLGHLVDARTVVLYPQNGMAWWYPVGLKAPLEPPPLPQFGLARAILPLVPAERLLGGVIYSANEMPAPGVVHNNSPGRNAIELGAIVPEGAEAAARLREVFRCAGLAAPDIADVRSAMWQKLLVNMSGSAIALATGNLASISRHDPELAQVYDACVHEGLAIARAHGFPLDDRLDPVAMRGRLHDHKPSLLQDYEKGRMMEVAEIVQAPLAFARAAGVPAPVLLTLAAIVSRLASDRGLLAGASEA